MNHLAIVLAKTLGTSDSVCNHKGFMELWNKAYLNCCDV
jgi:hypothetical protein